MTPTRITASIGYAGGVVGAEVDVSKVVPQEYESENDVWRYPAGHEKAGQFAPEPDLAANQVQRRAESAVRTAAKNVKSGELARELRNAEVSIEGETRVETPPTDGTQTTFRIDPEGNDNWVEYDIDGERLSRRTARKRGPLGDDRE